ncbi:hypothetical protein JNUCC0626_47815 [Lentzea sp. JNUCC 0626]|uniref:hypothetical protein n=1 Tax=Lentzea sp. JNUCC 0626 TaxID=3367513 RepID=UPI003749AEE5
MNNAIRQAAISALCAAAFVGVVTTSAQAADEWTVHGPDRTSFEAASADKSATEALCQKEDGQAVDSYDMPTVGKNQFVAYVQCRSKRG